MLEYKKALSQLNAENISLILAPTVIYLPLFKDANIKLCVQNIGENSDLTLTGDITIDQLKSVGVKYAIIGHYERRKYYGEKEYNIIKKVKYALDHNLRVIYCIGETIEEAARKIEYQVCEKQLARVLNHFTNEQIKNIIIAYEPSYLIGKSSTYDLLKIRSMILMIKKLVNHYYHTNIDVVFGGNVQLENLDDLLNLKVMDGIIVCSSILNPENIPKIIEKLAAE